VRQTASQKIGLHWNGHGYARASAGALSEWVRLDSKMRLGFSRVRDNPTLRIVDAAGDNRMLSDRIHYLLKAVHFKSVH